MTASLTPNREITKAALWWLFQGSTIIALFADTTGASPAPALDGTFLEWSAYFLDNSFDVYMSGGTVIYDATVNNKAKLPQLELVVDFATSITYTDIVMIAIPAISAGAGAPEDVTAPFVGLIHESSAVTVGASETKTYNIDLFSELL